MTDNSHPLIKQEPTGVPRRIVNLLIVVAVLLCFSPPGQWLGQRLLDSYSVWGLSTDARELLEKAGIRAGDLRAEVVPWSRAGFVTLTVTEAQAKSLRKALTEDKQFHYNACTSLPAFKERTLELYVEYSRVGLSSGRTFAPIRFYFKRATGEGCLEVVYGYS